MGEMVTRRNRELTQADIEKITTTYHNRRTGEWDYEDSKWFCKSASLEEVAKHDYVLTPGRYVGVEVDEMDDATFEEKMATLTAQLAEQMEQSKVLDEKIKENLDKIGFSL